MGRSRPRKKLDLEQPNVLVKCNHEKILFVSHWLYLLYVCEYRVLLAVIGVFYASNNKRMEQRDKLAEETENLWTKAKSKEKKKVDE
jgi:hypothetical protein